ncbi:hypothetical protein BD410DRAFT_115429 [Rickenella mellea]|uniref:Uncharacterized protein n=1 Tax=Rickenella mellea TaxID=50990 RepID=A0A4Y7Q9Y7_9AGAM|nr:hypothetical protein BD410DRAFT_115429 [Rickenella mellea]
MHTILARRAQENPAPSIPHSTTFLSRRSSSNGSLPTKPPNKYLIWVQFWMTLRRDWRYRKASCDFSGRKALICSIKGKVMLSTQKP